MLIALTLALAAQAEEPALDGPSAVRQCADAAEGTEVEVCLRLAATHPDEVDGIAAALRARIDKRGSGDRDLLDGTLMLLTAERAVEGATLLAATADPRAIEPLVLAVETREDPVALAAVRALSAFPQALPALVRWVQDPRRSLAIREAAVAALGRVRDAEGADAILATLRRRGIPPRLRQTMIDVVERDFPERTPELARQVTTDGTLWLSAAGAWGLAWPLGAAGHLGGTRLAGPGFGTGLAAGATLGWVSGSAWPMEAEDAAFVTSAGMIGTASGALVGSALAGDGKRQDGTWIGGLAGEAVGYTSGFALRQRHTGHVPDAIEATAFAGTAALAAGTLTQVVQQPSTLDPVQGVSAPQLAAGVGFAAGGVAGHLLAPRVRPVGADGWVMAVGAASGAVAGALVPLGGLRRYQLPLGGLALGYLAGYGLSNALDADRGTLLGGVGGLVLGGAVGWGAGSLATANDPTSADDLVRGAALAGGGIGLVTGTLLTQADDEPVDPRDVAALALVSAWGAWQGAGWAVWADTPVETRGAVLAVPAVAGIAVGVASPMLDVPLSYTYAAASLGIWGAYLGGVAGQLAEDGDLAAPGSKTLLYALVASDVGLAAGLVAASPFLNTPPLVIGMGDAGGVLLGASAALVVGLAGGEPEAALLASLGGAAVGFTGGALVASALHRSGRTRDLALRMPEPGRVVVAPTVLAGAEGPAWGARLEVTSW